MLLAESGQALFRYFQISSLVTVVLEASNTVGQANDVEKYHKNIIEIL